MKKSKRKSENTWRQIKMETQHSQSYGTQTMETATDCPVINVGKKWTLK